MDWKKFFNKYNLFNIRELNDYGVVFDDYDGYATDAYDIFKTCTNYKIVDDTIKCSNKDKNFIIKGIRF